MDNVTVSKFGGSITASADTIRRAAEIIRSDPSRKYVIASAPGTKPGETGITDMLFMSHSSRGNPAALSKMLGEIAGRFRRITDGLGLAFDIDAEISQLREGLDAGKGLDYIASRGEYITAKILAGLLGWPMADAEGLIFFREDGTLDEAKTFSTAGAVLRTLKHAVIPGFYGSMPDGSIKTFQRGDGDSSGAIVARAVNAGLFEKWSETAKIFVADPAVVPEAGLVRNITYDEAVEFNYLGLNIVSDRVIFMMRGVGIPVRVCSLEDQEGTLISGKLPEGTGRGVTACIAGRSKFNVLHIEKYGINKISGFGEKLFGIFARHGVACEHCLSGIYKMSVVIKSPLFHIRRGEILDEVRRVIEPDSMTVEGGLSLIAVVGGGMETLGRIFPALSGAGIKVRMIDQGSDSMNVILGVNDEDYADAVRALHSAMIRTEARS
ncbi:MAG: hypothetical protein IJP86_06085 [Synergistaceae bacterium]|nr:hypothetical protein [Synergistaceae bacterium]